MAFCTRCGANLPDNARFCGICGSPLNNQPARSAAAGYNSQYAQSGQSRNYDSPYAQPAGRAAPAYDSDYGMPRSFSDGGGRRPAEQEKKPVRHLGILRILSLLFALGLIVCAAGFGARLYFDRTYDCLHDELIAKAAESNSSGSGAQAAGTISTIDNEIIKKSKGEIREVLAAALCEDAGRLKNAVKALAVHLLKDMDGLSEIYNGQKDEINALLSDFLNAVDNKTLREPISLYSKDIGKEVGIRWLLLQIGARSMLLVIAGGGLAVLSLILWLVLGGPSAGAVRSFFLPALIVALVLAAAAIVLMLLVVKPVDYETLSGIQIDYTDEELAKRLEAVSSLSDAISAAGSAVAEKHQLLLIRIATAFISKYLPDSVNTLSPYMDLLNTMAY